METPNAYLMTVEITNVFVIKDTPETVSAVGQQVNNKYDTIIRI